MSKLAKREQRLAFYLLVPTVVIVLMVVLFPLIANFWISFKDVRLGDLRIATPIANERLRGGETPGEEAILSYRIRNSSQQDAIKNVFFVDDLHSLRPIPERLPQNCRIEGGMLFCELGDFPPKFRTQLEIPVVVSQEFLESGINPRDSKPVFEGQADSVLVNLEFTLKNYRRMLESEDFFEVLKVSFIYTFFGTVGALILGLLAALLLNQSFRGKGVVRGIFLFPYVAPVIAVAFSWVILLDPFSGSLNEMLKQVGLIETSINFFGQRYAQIDLLGFSLEVPLALFSVIAFESWRYFPLAFLFILAKMQSFPSELYEAAEIDGATPFQQFFSVSLPQMLEILGVLFLLRFIWTFNKFDDIFLLTGGAAGTRTLTVDVYEQGFAISNLGSGAAVAVVIFVILLSFTLLFFKISPKR